MRCLTIKKQWADLIADGIKKIENRTWGKNVRGKIAIHAGGNDGAIIAIAEIETVLDKETASKLYPEQTPYILGPLCWVIKSVKKLEKPVFCKGKLSLWNIDDSLISQ